MKEDFAFGPDTPGPRRPWRPVVSSLDEAVVAGHPLAAEAAMSILREGGNAVDAGVAAGIMLAVVESPVVGFAGVAPSLYLDAARGTVEVSSGVGSWPAAASSAYFREVHGGAIPKGVLRTVVPSAPHVWLRWLERNGTISFGRAAAPALRAARRGFVMNTYMAHIINSSRPVMADWPASIEHFFKDGRDLEAGDVFRQESLADSIELLCDAERQAGGDRIAGLKAAHRAFYEGEIARKICAYYAEEGGLLSLEDMRSIDIPIEPAGSTTAFGHTFYAGHIWGQGLSFLQAVRILEGLDLGRLGHNSAGYIHHLVELAKLLSADREAYFGDPKFVEDVSAALLSDTYIALRRSLIDPGRALPFPQLSALPGRDLPGHVVPPKPGESEQRATTYLAVVDKDGNLFSATPSDGSRHGPMVPGTGLAPSGRGATSKTQAGHPAELMPGKRPRMMTGPLLAKLADGSWLAFGSPGADTQLQANLQVLCNHLLFGMDIQSAVEAPRFSSFGFPGSFAPQAIKPQVVKVEETIGAEVRAELGALGHKVETWAERPWMAGSVGVLRVDGRNGARTAAADPRRNAYAIGAA